MFDGGIGTSPYSMLELSHKSFRLTQGKITGDGWSKPVRKLKERAKSSKVCVLVFHIHLGTLPCNLLLRRSNQCNFCWYLRKDGNSFMWQDPMSRVLNIGSTVAFIVLDSVITSRLLSPSWREVRFCTLKMSTTPVRPFESRASPLRSLRVNNDSGIEPCSLFSPRSRPTSLLRFPIQDGMGPVSWL